MTTIQQCMTVLVTVTLWLVANDAQSQSLNHEFLPGLEFLADAPQPKRALPARPSVRPKRTVPAAVESGTQLLFFHASWCGPCKRMTPFMRTMRNVVDVDIDQRPDLKDKYGVTSIPVVVVLRGGLEVGRMVGYASKETLQNWVNSLQVRRVEPADPRVQWYESIQPTYRAIQLDRQYSGVWLGSS